jgi:prepilin-type N-terminal cleavage/methylation domain-containing protein
MTDHHLSIPSSSAVRQQGFTLIEMIMILVVIGILASVAVPSFHGLMTEAQNRNALKAVMEAKNRLSNQYAITLMTDDKSAIDIKTLVSRVNTDAGDYKLILTVSEETQEVNITAVGVQERGVAGKATGTWRCL